VVGGGGWVEKLKLKLNSAQLMLELGLSLAKICLYKMCQKIQNWFETIVIFGNMIKTNSIIEE
jgi:hypothetical protein